MPKKYLATDHQFEHLKANPQYRRLNPAWVAAQKRKKDTQPKSKTTAAKKK